MEIAEWAYYLYKINLDMPKPTPEEFKAAWAEVTGGADTITPEQLKSIRDKFGLEPPEERLAKLKALFDENGGKLT